MATDLRQTHFRFGKDDGTESAHTFWQLEDANHSQYITADWTFLLRFCEQESGGTAARDTDAQFQYNRNGLGWNNITTTSSVVKAVAVGAFTNGQACTKRLSGTGTFETTGAGCTEDGTSGGTANDIAASGNSETEAGLQVVYADVANNDTIQLRFTSPDWTVTYTITPTLTITKPVSVTVTPGTLATTTTRYTPTVSVSDNKTVTPGTLSSVTTRYTPTVTVAGSVTVIPGTASLTTTRFIPSVIVGKVVIPGTLALVMTRYVPTVSISQNTLVTPNTASLNLTTFIPLALLHTTYAAPFLWTSANWGSVNIYLEVYIRAITGTVYARLIDSDGTIITNSEVNTALTSFQRLRSNALTLVNAKTYRVQFGKIGTDAGEFLGAKLIVIPS